VKLPPTARLLLAIAFLGLAPTACRTPVDAETKARSFAPFADHEIGRASLCEFLAARTGHIVIKPTRTKIEGVYDAGGGSAVPITNDGYHLTAAHVFEDAKPSEVFLLLPGSTIAHRVRLVWSGFRDTNAEMDLALIHVKPAASAWFEWAPDDRVVAGTPVVSSGFPAHELAFAGGRLLTGIEPDGRITHKLDHDAPLAQGDSGGPLCTPDGKLVAVNYGWELPFPGSEHSTAQRPDLDWLFGVIARDRRSRK